MKLLLHILMFSLSVQIGLAQSVQILDNINRMSALSSTVELSASRFIPLRNVGSVPRTGTTAIFPQELILHKYNRITNNFVDSVRILGDTVQTDSFLIASSVVSCYVNGRIYFLASNAFFGPSVTGQHLSYTVVDTNLHVIVPQKRIVSSKLPSLYRQLFDLRFYDNKLILLYTYTYNGGNSFTSRILEMDLSGQVLKDTVAGVMPDTLTNTYQHHATQILRDKDQPADLFVAGTSLLAGNSGFSLFRTDTSLRVKQSFPNALSTFVISNSYEGLPSGIGYSDIKNGRLFSGGNFFVTSMPAPACNNWQITALHSHLKANNYAVNKTLLLPNIGCGNNSSGDFSYKKLFHSETDQFVYYASANHDGPSGAQICDTSQNDIQVVCADTNLNLRWKKFISPKAGRCAKITQVLQPIGGSGITIIGFYLDSQSPINNSLKGGFILHVDSTGTLDAGSIPSFDIHNRFTVYPNPARNGFWIEDAISVPAKAFLYDLAGRQVGVYNLTGRKNWLESPAGRTGMFLLRVIPEWGEGYSQIVQIAE